MTPFERQIYLGLMQFHRAVCLAPAFVASRGEAAKVVSERERKRLDEVLAAIERGENPYHRKGRDEGGDTQGSRSALPKHVREKDDKAMGIVAPIVRMPVSDRRRRGPKTASEVFDGPITRTGTRTPAPGCHFCVHCGREVNAREVVFGWMASAFKPTQSNQEPLELTLNKSIHNEQIIGLEPPTFREVITHYTAKALPSCRACSPLFAKIKFPNRHGQRFE